MNKISHMPKFNERASCVDYPAEWWFPQELAGNRTTWSRTGDAQKAREICQSCPAFWECRTYSLRYSGLFGIWADTDWYQRKELQDKLGITPVTMMDTWKSGFTTGEVEHYEE